MRISFYIDGFNLYYGLRLRKKHATNRDWVLPTGKYKWLNIETLCKRLKRNDEIISIKYFTARITSPTDAILRQQHYLNALKSTPLVEIIEGHFLESYPTMKLCEPPHDKVKVIKQEEKRTDVNIASHMLIDGFHDKYDAAALITNDSDLCYPISFIRNELKKPVFVFNPQLRPSKSLKECATSIYHINDNTLKSAQFPRIVEVDGGKKFSRPTEW